MRQDATSVAAGLAVLLLVAMPSVQAPLQESGQQVSMAGPTEGDDEPGEGPAVPEDWPEHWPRPRPLDPAEIRVVESAPYLYSTWYGSPQAGLSPAAALAAHRGLNFRRFVQFGERVYFVPVGSFSRGGSVFQFILNQAIVDTAFHLCPDGEWPELKKRFRRARNLVTFANTIGPGDSIQGFSKPNPVHCYWRHMPAAEWDGSRLVPPPRFDEVWGEEDEDAGSASDR